MKERIILLSPFLFGKPILLFCVEVVSWLIRRFKLAGFFMLHSMSLKLVFRHSS